MHPLPYLSEVGKGPKVERNSICQFSTPSRRSRRACARLISDYQVGWLGPRAASVCCRRSVDCLVHNRQGRREERFDRLGTR